MARFSVIIPMYNVEKFVKECVFSVLAQTFTDYEVILVDDGATDNSGKVCDELAEKDSKVSVIHQQNGGLSMARNAGVKKAVGEYVIFLDGDDYWSDKEMLSKISQKLSVSEADVLVFNFVKYFEKNGKCETKDNAPVEVPTDKIEAAKTLLKSGLFNASACFKCIRRSLIVDNNLQFETGRLSEDIEWNGRLLILCKRLDCINESFYVYRRRSGSISHNLKEKNVQHLFDNIVKTYNYAEEYKLEEAFRRVYFSYVAYQYATLCFCINRLEGKKLRADWVKKIAPYKELLKYGYHKKVKLLSTATRLLGLKIAIKLMYVIRNKNA